MQNLLKTIQSGRILLSDGALGTMLFKYGLKPGDCPEQLNLTDPDILINIALEYLDAGADIIQTNTFGGSPAKLSQYGLEEQTNQINHAAVLAVKQAVKGRALVSGSCGPCGKILKPYGDAEPENIYNGFKLQISSLLEAGVDMVCVETMTSAEEAILAVKAARDLSKTIPVISTMTYDRTPRGFYTIMGVDIKTAVRKLSEAGADVIGSNCGNGIDNMIEIAAEFRKYTDMPLAIQSNAGLPKTNDGKLYYDQSAEYMTSRLESLLQTGVSVIGGCCGTDPYYIRAFRDFIDRYQG